MPRRHENRRRLPRWPTIFYTHPFELCLGLILCLIALRGVLSGQVTPSIDDTLPKVPRAAYQAVSGAAGFLIVLGLVSRERWKQGKGLEQAGLYLAGGAFAGYAIVLGNTAGQRAFVNVGTSLAICLACVLRARAIRRADLIKLRVLRDVNRQGGRP